ncbi:MULTISPECIES: ATP-binding protein [unclassified Streptomyces]|uniref:ATP-binding protein n=1 Tax=unclassified Streptomyces TaxID=2593676 RepID=UPI0025B48FB8|nr:MULTISPECIES: ATP-binding protein [unclassified Streptomyces]MDN3250588.1 ATP-binding protein [Streptomyces sp. ZSW22]MDN3257886.1 ATP-binding protein [Streptomyces sp. MA25(2023)]
MVIPLRQQTTDEHHPAAVLRYGAVWAADGTSIADARNAVRTLLARAGNPPHHQISQDTQIVVSELVTNALRHAPGPGGLLLEVLTTPARLRVTVRDTSRAAPRLRVPDPHRIGGHGLHLITRLCSHFHTSPRDDGKQVTAEMLLPQPAL